MLTIPSADPVRPDGVIFTDWLDSHLRAFWQTSGWMVGEICNWLGLCSSN